MEYIEMILIIYFIFISAVSLFLVMVDKKAAERHKRRIPEKAFFIISFLGGSVGVYLAMGIFNHKTQKDSFVFLIPLIFFLQCAMVFLLYKYEILCL